MCFYLTTSIFCGLVFDTTGSEMTRYAKSLEDSFDLVMRTAAGQLAAGNDKHVDLGKWLTCDVVTWKLSPGAFVGV